MTDGTGPSQATSFCYEDTRTCATCWTALWHLDAHHDGGGKGEGSLAANGASVSASGGSSSSREVDGASVSAPGGSSCGSRAVDAASLSAPGPGGGSSSSLPGSSRPRTCCMCGSPPDPSVAAKLKACGRCMSVQYCSPECQRRHWGEGGHKQACPQLREAREARVDTTLVA